ncbi:MAG: ABC transporter permease [Saccharofermentanales bacterium]
MQTLSSEESKDGRTRFRLLARKILPPALFGLLLILLVQLLSTGGLIRQFVLPPPGQVVRSLISDFPVVRLHLASTFGVALLGFLLAALAGTAIALLLDRFRLLSDALYPFIVVSQTIPTLVITPVIVLIFGYGQGARLFVVVLVCFFPLTINLLQGLRNVDQDLLDMMRTMGASRLATMRHVRLPASLPSFFAGLRISSTYCVMATVLAEWAGGGDGLGIYMLRMKRSFRYDAMFASILWIVALSLFFYLSAVLLERYAMPWREKHEDKGRKEAVS